MMNVTLLIAMTLLAKPSRQLDRVVVPNNVGVNVHEQAPYFNFSDGQNHKMFDFGFRAARIVISWAEAQIRPDGPWHLGAQDALVKQAAEAGLRPLILLDYNNFKITGGVSPDTPEKIALFDRYAQVCAERYKQFHPIYEIGNEPTHKTFWSPEPNVGNFTRLIVAASKAIKDTDPDAVVCAGCFFAVDDGFMQAFIGQGGLSSLDAISLHPYNHRAPESALPFYRHVQKLIKDQELDHRVGIMVTEWGYDDNWKALSKARAAEYYPRMYLVNLLAGIDMTIFYEWSDRGESQFNSFFGILDSDNQPKPAFNSLGSLLKKLEGYRLERFRANGPNKEYLMVFTKGSSTKVVGWVYNRDPDDIDSSTDDPKSFEEAPVQVEFEGRKLTLTSTPKVFDF